MCLFHGDNVSQACYYYIGFSSSEEETITTWSLKEGTESQRGTRRQKPELEAAAAQEMPNSLWKRQREFGGGGARL